MKKYNNIKTKLVIINYSNKVRLLEAYTSLIIFTALSVLAAQTFIFTSAVYANDFAYEYTKTIGGNGWDGSYDIAVDSQNNVYLAGYFEGSDIDFDPGPSTDLHSSIGSWDIFITKFNENGSYAFTKTIGGPGEQYPAYIAFDDADNLFLVGHFQSSDIDFDPGPSSDLHSSVGDYDVFVTKFNTDGSYEYTKTMGGAGQELASEIEIDGQNNIYISGHFEGNDVDFDPGPSTDLYSSIGSYDVFIVKLNADESYAYTSTFGGIGWDAVTGLEIDNNDDLYTVGYFQGSDVDFDPGPSTDLHSSNGSYDIFLAKISGDGTYEFTQTMGGTSVDYPWKLALDSNDNVYFGGEFQGSDVDFDPGPSTDLHSSNGSRDIFFTKINKNGSYGFTKTIGGAAWDGIYGIELDSADNLYVAGWFEGSDVDFDPSEGTDLYTSNGSYDTSLIKFDTDGNYGYTLTMGGPSADWANNIVFDSNDNLYMLGYFEGSDMDFDPGVGENIQSSNGSSDVYLSKFTGDGVLSSIEDAGPNAGDGNNDGILDSNQPSVSSLPNNVVGSGAYVTLETTDACTTISSVTQDSEDNQSTTDDGFNYPLGITDFTLNCDSAGDTATITLYYDQQYDTSDWVVKKYANNTYTTLDPSTYTLGIATVGSNAVTTLSYQVTDGGELDEDGTENGIIVDPIGVAVADSDDSETLANTGVNINLIGVAAIAVFAVGLSIIFKNKHRILYTMKI